MKNTLINNLVSNLIDNDKPSDFFEWMKSKGFIGYFKELNSLVGVPQEPKWHPEGDVWVHTLLVINKAATFKHELSNDFDKIVYMFSALCHDFGKPYTTYYENHRFRSPMHDTIGMISTKSFMQQLGFEEDIINSVANFVKEHLIPTHLYNDRERISDATIIRLENRVNIDQLILLGKADHFGRTVEEAHLEIYPAGEWLLERYNRIRNRKIISKPIITGKFLLSLNIKQGKLFAYLIKEGYKLQLEGKICSKEDAILWINNRMGKK